MALSERERAVIGAVSTGVLIDGEPREGGTGRRFTVEDPATGEALCDVADADGKDALAALDAACAAQRSWAATAPRERSEVLRRAFALMTARTDDLALLMTLEMGKPLAESKAEVAYAADFFRWFSEEAVRVYGRWSTAPTGDHRLLTMRQPVGPCLLVTPWNFPLAMGTRKIGPALAAGCTVVMKPARLTPLCTLALAAILAEAGVPDGVFNVVPSSSAARVVAPLLADSRLRKLSFTGSTQVGVTLMEQAAANLLRVSMELGGNAPFLVFPDADLDAAVEGALVAKLRNIGQSCVAANRFHVHVDVVEEFTGRLADRMRALSSGRGTDAGVDVGPLIDDEQRGVVDDLVHDAIDHGARLVCGGEPMPGAGYFYAPTVLAAVPVSARILHEEVFGPVAPIRAFSDEHDAVSEANDTEYGLAAYVYTRDLGRALRVTEALETGMVGVNRGMVSNPAGPFGGVKHSGFGREGGEEGIEEYLSVKYVALDT